MNRQYFSNGNTTSLHITSACNRRCTHCYMSEHTRDLDVARTEATLATLSFDNLLLYGGEPLMRPDSVRGVMARHPDKGFRIATNGTLSVFAEDILDRVDDIMLTVESFAVDTQPPFRRFGRKQHAAMLGTLRAWSGKITLLHNIYPWGNDPDFFHEAERRGLRVAVYPVVMPGSQWSMDETTFRSMRVLPAPLTMPKLRVLENGTLTRDMRGVYNGTDALPMSEVCQRCDLQPACPFVSMFPHFVKDVIDSMTPDEPWFCSCTRSFAC